jgi:predicted RNA-binding protein with TRAM domain
MVARAQSDCGEVGEGIVGMNLLGYVLIGLGVLLLGMGGLSLKWGQKTSGRQVVNGLIVIVAGVYLLLRS